MVTSRAVSSGPMEVGVKIIFYGIRYSENIDLIRKMAETIKKDAKGFTGSGEKPKAYIIIPLSAYDYG